MAESSNPSEGSKPTPTQDENDRAKLGEHIMEHEADGSPPDPNAEAFKKQQEEATKKQAEARKPGAVYRTRQYSSTSTTS